MHGATIKINEDLVTMRYVSPDMTANTNKLCLYRSLVNNEMKMLQEGNGRDPICNKIPAFT